VSLRSVDSFAEKSTFNHFAHEANCSRTTNGVQTEFGDLDAQRPLLEIKLYGCSSAVELIAS
jgi:hypothetical protein